MTAANGGRESVEVEALVTDGYLDTLLAAHARGADAAPTPHRPAPDITWAADRLARDLTRLHPSFRFEEALAARLAEAAARMRLKAAAGAERTVVPIRDDDPGLHLLDDAEDDGSDAGRSGLGRPLIIGGALTSAALSIAGAAYVAWRWNRPSGDPMARAIRAVARSRTV